MNRNIPMNNIILPIGYNYYYYNNFLIHRFYILFLIIFTNIIDVIRNFMSLIPT